MKYLSEIGPEDEKELKKLFKAVTASEKMDIPLHPVEQMNPLELARLMASGIKSAKYVKNFNLSIEEYIERFKSEDLKFLFRAILPAGYKAQLLPFMLGTVLSGNGERPKGGSLAMAQRMAARYEKLGGKIIYNASVNKIIVKDTIGTGIEYADQNGTASDFADWIIPACDVHVTLSKLLDNKYPVKAFDERDADSETYPGITCSLAAFKYEGDLSAMPADNAVSIEPVPYEDGKIERMTLKHFCYEPSFAPEGCSSVQCIFQGNYDWWSSLIQDEKAGTGSSVFVQSESYKKEKKRVLEDLTKALEKRYPFFKGKLKALDLATPLTYERYCGAYKGSYMSYTTTVNAKQLMHNGFIPGLEHVVMSGQWLMPSGGLPVALITGKWTVERICKKDKKNWRL